MTKDELEDMASGRLHQADIHRLCAALKADEHGRRALLEVAAGPDLRAAYNALWIFTHFTAGERRWLWPRRDLLADMALAETHIGKLRLELNLLESMDWEAADVRADLLDFCLERVCSELPYGVRALCMKLACKLCLPYAELRQELAAIIDGASGIESSPGLRSARRQVLRSLEQAKNNG